MSSVFKKIEREQCQNQVNKIAKLVRSIPTETDWIQLVRTALGMNSTQLARLLGVSRNQALKLEKAELVGGITIRRLEEVAQSMKCRLVYAFVPENNVEEIIKKQARLKAEKIMKEASIHMMLEAQSLPHDVEIQEINRLADKFIDEMGRELWNK